MSRENDSKSPVDQTSESDAQPDLRLTFWWILAATVLTVITTALLVLAVDYVLLIFLGVLFGIFLTKCSGLIGRIISIPYGWSLTIVTTTLLAMIIGGFLLFGAQVERRISTMSDNLDKAVSQLDGYLDSHSMARDAFHRIPFAGELLAQASPAKDGASGKKKSTDNDAPGVPKDEGDTSGNPQANQSGDSATSSMPNDLGSIAGRAARVINRIFSTTLGLVANLGMIFFVGMFLAVDPTMYRDGLARLFPMDRRDRVTEIMDGMSDKMFGWLNGRFIAMLITGVGTGISLLILGVPMAITIGVLTGLLTFVPNIGGILALALASLMAVPQGGTTVLWVLILYGVIQLIESNIITPLVQQNKTSIPPALLIVFQILMGALTGFLGVLVATPLLAGLLVLVKEVWVRDCLGDEAT